MTACTPLPVDSAFLYENVLVPPNVTFVSAQKCDRIGWQARVCGFFNQVDVYDEIRLTPIKDAVCKEWKPYLIRHVMSNLKYGDLLCFCNSDYNISTQGSASIELFGAILSGNEYDSIVFNAPNRKECQYTKMDMLRLFPQVTFESRQYSSDFFILKKTIDTVKIVEQWCNLTALHSSAETTEPNLPTFVNCDVVSSLFSLLMKQTKKSFEVENAELLFN